jgi:predicted RNase H-like HicB family nuclease
VTYNIEVKTVEEDNGTEFDITFPDFAWGCTHAVSMDDIHAEATDLLKTIVRIHKEEGTTLPKPQHKSDIAITI